MNNYVQAGQEIAHGEPYIAPSSLGVLIRKRGLYYRPSWRGYTASIDEAGRYDEAVAKRHAAKSEGVTVERFVVRGGIQP